MAQTGTYKEELEKELKQTDPSSHASRLVVQEIARLTKGEDDKKERHPVLTVDLHHDRPQKLSIKVRIPVKEFPRYNFVGKLLGPKGETLKALQEHTGCKMAIMGKGSMREKEKEEELRKEGGKYAHLNEDLHVLVECYTEMTDGYYRLAAALAEIKKFIHPDLAEDMYVSPEGDVGANGGAPRGRGAYRGGPPPRGGFRGRGNGPVPPPPAGRGAPPTRPPRGTPRGAPSGRGAPSARGARPAAPSSSYDGYSSQGYASGYGSGYDASYDEAYGSGYPSGQETSYYDYGAPASSSGAVYDPYSGGAGYDYGDGWSSGGKAVPPSSRGGSRGQARSHPYSRTASSSY